MNIHDFKIFVANEFHVSFAQEICDEMAVSAQKRGTGIAKRTPHYIESKIREGKAVIALYNDGSWAGFSYIESWENENYVANSGLIINPLYRELGLARAIKQKTFALSIKLYPNAKLFGLTTGLAVMKINNQLGYRPVTYTQLTKDEKFWAGCQSCVNFEVLTMKEHSNCLCTAMIFDPKEDKVAFDIEEVLSNDTVLVKHRL